MSEYLGGTGLRVPEVCVGTYTLAGAWGGDLDAATAGLRHGLDRGLVFFDTAHAYGRAESALGRVLAPELAGHRDEIVLCSKGGLDLRRRAGAATPFAPNSRPEFLRACLVDSLRRLGTDHVDVYLVHWFDPAVPIAETAGAMASFVKEGLARHIGVSNYTVGQMAEFERSAALDVIQVPYSLFSRGAERELLPYARERNLGVMGYAALAQGYLSGTFTEEPSFSKRDFRRGASDFSGDVYTARVHAAKEMRAIAASLGCGLPELAMAWVRAGEQPVVPLVGIQAPEHVDSILTAAELDLAPDVLARLRTIAASAPEMDFDALVTS
ncbi:aldo/keto reductase [Streptosporangium sp. NPDC006013]|uniref:aldo/keto reductase n=1 Tax=Streptosporangium sp. NPDC006013 TaxID=3155596 RepID=UPI0033B69F5B